MPETVNPASQSSSRLPPFRFDGESWSAGCRVPLFRRGSQMDMLDVGEEWEATPGDMPSGLSPSAGGGSSSGR